ncbi:hypothetical protein CQW23_17898 [Capsicum baccatum]|uniref:F-box associated beta-propeller type 3 domain-containing protein n=1 Tax=Capsicum baccatum TaxID=33114 RepID=A0A2G2WF57_CAPBA|nr:hypothetical protein CQW23_17898 [Capsicum baccatum]
MLPVEKLNGENNGVKQENSESDEQDNGLINQEDMEKLNLEEQTSSETETNHSVVLRIAQPELNLKECPIMEETNLDYHMKNSDIACVIEGSVNGLICLVNEAKELFLWNPAIRKYKKLSDFRTKLNDDGQCTYGFGFDDIHDDYKGASDAGSFLFPVTFAGSGVEMGDKAASILGMRFRLRNSVDRVEGVRHPSISWFDHGPLAECIG